MISRFIIFIVVVCASLQSHSQEIVMSGSPVDFDKYNTWLNGRTCAEISSFESSNAYRVTIEIMLMCKALTKGGLTPKFILLNTPNYPRSLHDTRMGTAAMPSESVRKNDAVNEHFYVTDPIFEPKEYSKGLYAASNIHDKISPLLLRVKTKKKALDIVRQFSVLSSQAWAEDWSILNKLEIPVIHASNMELMCILLKNNRGDLYMGDLAKSIEDKTTINCNGLALYLIRGLKVSLPQSRHFIVSKKYPNSKVIFDALNHGVKLLRQSGELQKALSPHKPNQTKTIDWVELTH